MIGTWYFLVLLFWMWVAIAVFCLLAGACQVVMRRVARWLQTKRTIAALTL